MSYILSGKIPPNPAEIIMNKRLRELFSQIKRQYDYIVVDNPPIAMVVDILTVINEADLMLYLVRSGYVDKKALEIPQKLVDDKKINNIATVLNFSRQRHGSFHYGYGYGYGEKGDKQQNLIQRLFKSFRS
jgi:Mrp family chromosome partitioning ATPase